MWLERCRISEQIAVVRVLEKTLLATSRSSRLCSEQAVHIHKIQDTEDNV